MLAEPVLVEDSGPSKRLTAVVTVTDGSLGGLPVFVGRNRTVCSLMVLSEMPQFNAPLVADVAYWPC